MKPPPLSRRNWLAHSGQALLAASLGAGAMLSPGCALRARPALPRRTFSLLPPRPASPPPADSPSPSTSTSGGVLLVRLLRVAATYDSRAFIIRQSEVEFTTDAYHAFLVSPGALITDALAQWLRDLGAFAEVSTGGSQLPPSHILEGEIEELCGDYRDPAQPKASLALRLRLLHPLLGANPPVRWQRREHRAIRLTDREPGTLVTGWNQALTEIAHAFESDFLVKPAVADHPQA